MASLPCLFFFTLMLVGVESRALVSNQLISDGHDHEMQSSTSFLTLHNLSLPSSSSLRSSSDACLHVYGFFPCADNIGGYIFQMIVYQYMLMLGEKLLTRGSNNIFNILGTGIFGASLFRVLMVLPGLVMVIVSGVFADSGNAEQQVSLGVAVYTGTTVLYLTLLWGMCVIFGRTVSHEKYSSKVQGTEASTSKPFPKEGNSPFMIQYQILAITIFNTLYGSRVVILIAFIVSALSLLSYFIYQVLDPWIQERSLEYFKYQNLLTEFLNHAEKCGKAKLINENGEPNISLIKRLFAESDKDRSQHLTTDELEALIRQMESVNLEVDNAYAVNVILEVFDRNKDGKISEHEFVEGCMKWIDESKELAQKDDCKWGKSLNKRKNSLQVVQPLINKKKEELAKIEHFMARILKKIQSEAIDAGCLLNDDGKPDLDRINSLFDKYDSDKNKVISQLELRSLIQTVKFGDKWITNHDMVVDKVMKDFDDDGDQLITSEEFVRGVTRWLKKATHETKCTDAKRSVEEYDKILWKEVDSMVNEEQVGQKTYKLMLTWGFNKALLQVILGFMMLTYLASPLSRSTRQFSNAVGIPSFFISFVIIPVAMQARKAIAAIFPAAQKNKRTASLTFSELYGNVVMNNIMGMTTLLAIVYVKDLRWDYSAEVLIMLVVCAVIGLVAFLSSKYPLWTCLLAFSLYPFSLVLFYVLQSVWGWK
ncbi:sodium/calcium exchanger NCL2-like [Apium graveolens]|uniref:sodium/calcium exchanger NCL2-like n=2 Tax=Apium graveolens TaxID=4045 RepID=UPI003D7BFD8D